MRSTGDAARATPLDRKAIPGNEGGKSSDARPRRPGIEGSSIMFGVLPFTPRASMGYTATLALLHESMAAFASARPSLLSGNPDVNRIRLLRPGISVRFLARPRKAISMLRAPKSPIPLVRRGPP